MLIFTIIAKAKCLHFHCAEEQQKYVRRHSPRSEELFTYTQRREYT